jgi:Tfp pilus assembly protein PilE
MVDLKTPKGLTIAEVIVACALVAIITAVAYNFYVLAKDAWTHAFVQGSMQNDAILAIEQMVYGVGSTRKGIQEAQDIIAPIEGASTSQIEYVDQDDDALTRLFFQNGDRLVYTDENDINSDIINNSVQTLTFTRPAGQADLIQINLVLQRMVRGRAVTVILATSTRLRNID